jgi:hypothetical protein
VQLHRDDKNKRDDRPFKKIMGGVGLQQTRPKDIGDLFDSRENGKDKRPEEKNASDEGFQCFHDLVSFTAD